MSGERDRRAERTARPAVVVAGGAHEPLDVTSLPGGALVICADAGLAFARALGLSVDIVVGDFDSVDLELFAQAEREGVEIDRHSPDKDQTDLELALARARDAGCTDVTVLGLTGGRLDHFVANVLVLASDQLASLRVRGLSAGAIVHVVRTQVILHARHGRTVTLLAVGGPAHGVVTTGLAYPLDSETLVAGSGRGVSNEMSEGEATVAVAGGVLLAIQTNEKT